MAPNQSQIDNLYAQAQGVQSSINQYAKSKGKKLTQQSGGAFTASPITTNQLQPVQPYNLNLQTPQVPSSGLESSINGSVNAYKTQGEQERAQRELDQKTAKTDLTASMNEIIGLNTDIANVGNTVDRTAEDTARKDADRYTSEIEAEQLSNRRKIENLQKNNPQGLFGGGLEQEVNRVNRDSLSKQADLAILQNSALRNYSTAKDIADREVQNKLEPLKVKLENLKFFYQENKELFNKEDERLYNEKIKSEERAYEKEENLQNQISSIKLEVAKNQAPSNILMKLSTAKTLDEAIQIGGKYLISPMEKLQMAKLQGDIDKNTAELLLAKQTIGGTTGDPTKDIILGSSRYGDKQLIGGQLEKVQKAVDALGSMESLQSLLAQGKDGVDTSGPLKGRMRTLATQLGGDADARAINATIQGLIPTVARGIFGEVGVLTDADIENYRKTVPNLNASGEQNKLISLVMYDVLSRSLASTLTTNARNQVNVSGFYDLYTNAQSRIGTLKSQLGVVEATPIDPVNSAKLETSWNTMFSPQSITNSLNSFFPQ